MKNIFSMVLIGFVFVSHAADYTLVATDQNGQVINSCGNTPISSPINYTDSDCSVHMSLSSGGDVISLPLGDCPTNHKIKVILDNHMYKFNANIDAYNDLVGTLDVISINQVFSNCQGGGTDLSDLELFSTDEIVDLDVDFGVRWGVDSSGKPVIVMKSLTGNVVCDGGVEVTVNDGDVIFTNGFE